MENNDTYTSDKIHKALSGITAVQYEKYPRSSFTSIISKITNPSYYFVSIALFDFFNLPNYGTEDKVTWHTIIEYKKSIFLIRDYKFNSWTIEIYGNCKHSKTIAEELKKKIITASNYTQKYYQKEGESCIKQPYYYNNFNYLLDLLFFYKRRTKRNLSRLKPSEGASSMSIEEEISQLNINILSERKISMIMFPLVFSFISFFEFYLYLIFLFEYEDDENDFLHKTFREKVNKIKKPYLHSHFHQMLIDITNLKSSYRDPLAHGLLCKQTNIVCFLSDQIKSENTKFYHGFGQYSYEKATKDLNLISDTIDYISSQSPFEYYFMFGTTGIMLNRYTMWFLKKDMNSKEQFEQSLICHQRYIDSVVNRDI